MRKTPSNFLQKAIGEALKGVGVPVYDYIKENTPFPYITIGEETETPWDTKTGNGSEVDCEIHLWSQRKGYKENKDLAQKVLDAMFAASEAGAFSSAEWHCVDISLGRILHERLDFDTRHCEVTFKFLIQEVI